MAICYAERDAANTAANRGGTEIIDAGRDVGVVAVRFGEAVLWGWRDVGHCVLMESGWRRTGVVVDRRRGGRRLSARKKAAEGRICQPGEGMGINNNVGAGKVGGEWRSEVHSDDPRFPR